MIKKIEELSMNAFPALSTVLVNGWVLRFADGYSKRANSVNMIYECFNDYRKNISICEEMYANENLRSVFKVTEMGEHQEIDSYLQKIGYQEIDKTNVMLKEINTDGKYISDENIDIRTDLDDEWLGIYMKLNSVDEKNRNVLKNRFSRIIGKPYFLSLKIEGKVKGVGIGVDTEGYLGIFGIFISEDIRRCGYGTQIMESLVQKAAEGGAKYAYLQVVDSNKNAEALYRKIGYKHKYSYWYRVKEQKQ